jgi:hypothetical protein
MGFLALRSGCTVQAPAKEPVHSPTIMPMLTPTEPPSTEPTHAHTSSLDLAAAPNSTVHSEPHIPAQRVHLA